MQGGRWHINDQLKGSCNKKMSVWAHTEGLKITKRNANSHTKSSAKPLAL
jgi:hypothetical protein